MMFLFTPFLYGEIKFNNTLTKFNQLWAKLLDFRYLGKISTINFSYFPAILTFLTFLSGYLLILLILNSRKEIKMIYKLLFILYNIIVLYSLVNILTDNLYAGYFLINPNHLATFISVPIPLIIYILFIKKDINKDFSLKIIKFLYLLLLSIIIFLTNARMAMLSTTILITIYLYMYRKRIHIKFIALIILLFVSFLIYIFINKGVINSEIIVSKQITDSLSWSLRFEIIKNSFNILKNNLFFGVGPGQFSVVYPYYSSGKELIFIHHAHNDYIQFIVEYGLIGIMIIGFMYYKLIVLIRNGLKRLKGNSYHLFLATIFSILIYHLQIISSFQSHIGILFQMLIFLISSLYIIIYNFDKYYKSNSDELL